MEIVRKNLERLVGEASAGPALAEAYDRLGWATDRDLNPAEAEELAQHFIDRGGPYSFVGRSLRIHLSTQRVRATIRDVHLR